MREFLPEGCSLQGDMGIAFVIAGPSGAGKSSVISELLKRDAKLTFSVSATTRPKRPEEVHGRDYYFIGEGEFRRLVREGKFLEWTEYQGHLYGTLRDEVLGRLGAGHDVVLNVEVRGALAIARAGLPHPVVLIFLVPPSWEELERRIRARGTESPEDTALRLRIAREEVGNIPHFHYLVINDVLEQAVRDILAIIRAERMRLVCR